MRRPGGAARTDRFGVGRCEGELDAAHRRQLRGLGGLREPDGAVETVTVGEGHPGEAREGARVRELLGV